MPTNHSNPFKPAHKAPQPRREVFDPWNTASTGHQRAENRLAGSTSWQASRTVKLNAQFGSGENEGGGQRISDLVGAGSERFGEDGRTDTGWDDSVQGWRGRQGLTGKGWGDIEHMMKGKTQSFRTNGRQNSSVFDEEDDADDMPPPSAQQPREDTEDSVPDKDIGSGLAYQSRRSPRSQQSNKQTNISVHDQPERSAHTRQTPQIFSSLTILINGSTYPTVSDHKLKYLLTAHGARLSISHARRQVTHVIVGKAMSIGHDSVKGAAISAGGGLAGGKLEREITKKVGGGAAKGTKYVSVEWVTESIKAGIRLPESRFPAVNTAPRGVKSVKDMFKVV